MSAMISDVYVESVSAVLLPLHGCWLNPTHLYNMQNRIDAASEYVFQYILLCDLLIYSHKKELSGQQQHQLKSS